jgi:adhesin/invasin
MRRSIWRASFALALVAGVVGGAAAALGGAGGAAAGTSPCPASNGPNTLVLAGGTPQTAKLGTAFAANLEVALANTNGCPLTTSPAGVSITFTAPFGGAGGTFAASGSRVITVGTNATGSAVAPPFTANSTAGTYTVVASSDYGSVSFSLTNTASGVPASIGAVEPVKQSATAGSRYPYPLQARVLDAGGNPVPGTAVTFAFASTGASGSTAATAGAAFDGAGAQVTELTDANGYATSPHFTANAIAGAFTATASTSGIADPAVFSLDNMAGAPPTVSRLGAVKRSATVDSRYASPLQVKVIGADGTPVQGATVTFALGSGGGNGSTAGAGATFVGGTAQANATTDAAGIATSPRFTANGVAGTFTATASMADVAEPVTFTLANRATRPPHITAEKTVRSATVESNYYAPLRVRVRDAQGNPVHGASVTFSLGSTGGGANSSSASSAGATFAGGATQATVLTDTSGRASSPRFTANSVAGTFKATATSGDAAAAVFTLRNVAAEPHAIASGVASTESTVVGTRFPVPLAVKVTDVDGNPVQGVVVTFTAPRRGASGGFGHARARSARVKTNASGVAVAPRLTANAQPGGYVVTAGIRGVSRRAAFALINQSAG